MYGVLMICQWDFCVFSHLGLPVALVGKNDFSQWKKQASLSVSVLYSSVSWLHQHLVCFTVYQELCFALEMKRRPKWAERMGGKYASKEHSVAWHCSPSWWQRVAGSVGRARARRRRIQCELVRGWHSPLCPTLLSNLSGAQFLLCSLCLCVSVSERKIVSSYILKKFKKS